jgi:hypothetical protein
MFWSFKNYKDKESDAGIAVLFRGPNQVGQMNTAFHEDKKNKGRFCVGSKHPKVFFFLIRECCDSH